MVDINEMFPHGKSNPEATVSMGHMSNNVVDVMKALADNYGIRALLCIDEENPLDKEHKEDVPNSLEILKPNSDKNRITPVSFNMKAQVPERTEIRVYYNIGRFSTEGRHIDYNMHIDIICAKNLWLIKDTLGNSKIRPYEVMSRIFDVIGQRNINQINIGRPVQFQMLSVNERFDAIRIYFNTYDIVGDVDKVKGW